MSRAATVVVGSRGLEGRLSARALSVGSHMISVAGLGASSCRPAPTRASSRVLLDFDHLHRDLGA